MSKTTSTRTPSCALCKNPTVDRYKPFCSKRCADLDLGRWLGEGYRLPGDAPLDGLDTDDGEPTEHG